MYGVGTAVADTPYLLTVAHVVSDLADKTMLVSLGGYWISLNGAQLVLDPVNDAAVIRLPVLADNRLPLCYPRAGERVTVYTLRGEIDGVTTVVTQGAFGLTARLRHGDSGSAIVSDERQCVIGLATQILYDDGGAVVGSTGVAANVLMHLLTQQTEVPQ
jgi:S1-C subfamily serine protease